MGRGAEGGLLVFLHSQINHNNRALVTNKILCSDLEKKSKRITLSFGKYIYFGKLQGGKGGGDYNLDSSTCYLHMFIKYSINSNKPYCLLNLLLNNLEKKLSSVDGFIESSIL